MAVMMISTLLKGAFRNKYGFGIERLFLYTIPAMFVLPILMHTMLIMGTLVATVSVIFMMLAVTLLLTTITPYFDYVQPVMSDAFEKLPKHTVPVIETVTEEVEDEAKKGKFTTVTEDRLVKHKVAWRYHNWFGVLVITIVATVALVLSCSLGAYRKKEKQTRFQVAAAAHRSRDSANRRLCQPRDSGTPARNYAIHYTRRGSQSFRFGTASTKCFRNGAGCQGRRL